MDIKGIILRILQLVKQANSKLARDLIFYDMPKYSTISDTILDKQNGNFMSALNDLKLEVTSITAGDNVPVAVVTHLKNNLVTATHESSICVDGGYKPDQALGELARAGADLGISEALLTLGLSPQDAFKAVYEYRVSKGQKYGWHSDTHADHDHSIFSGCGHCNASFLNAAKYQVELNQVKELLEIVKSHQVEHPENMSYVSLDREHAEVGIFVVLTPEISVLPWDLETNQQFFVYDKTRDVTLLTEIAQAAKVDVDKLLQVADNQTNATLGLLGSSKGKPLYSVEYTAGVVTVNHVGNAPTE